VILAIDPGPVQSAWMAYDLEEETPLGFGIVPNPEVLDLAVLSRPDLEVVVIEKVEGFGMAVGVEVFETVFWTGRIAEAAARHGVKVRRLGRKAIKRHLCGTHRAKDPNVRQALLDRFGGSAAKGTKAAPGPLYGVSSDVWSALAVAVTFGEDPELATP
jgi:hypothetical protein